MNSRKNSASFEERLHDYRRTGRQDAANVLDVAEMREDCHIKADTSRDEAHKRIKKFLLENAEQEQVLSDDMNEGWTKAELRKFFEGWADEWASYAAKEVLDSIKERCICEDCRSYGCDPECPNPNCG